MVNGFQKRIERVARLRTEKKELKEAKAKGLIIAPEVILEKLLRAEPDPDVWLLHPNQSQQLLCFAHFRLEACTNRRCKWSHALTIANLKTSANIRTLADENDNPEAPAPGTPTTEPLLEHWPPVGPSLFPTYSMTRRSPSSFFERLDDLLLVALLDFAPSRAACAAAASCKLLRAATHRSASLTRLKQAALPLILARRKRELLKAANASR